MKKEMMKETYTAKLTLMETEQAIKLLKDYFESALSNALDLQRVSAPLFVLSESGLNDTLNGIERPVSFEFEGGRAEIVHSLAKWKRVALKRYGFEAGKGLYTDMNAIRRDETLGPLHSIYVDQWDWETIIPAEKRTLEQLKQVVVQIYKVFLQTEAVLSEHFPILEKKLPDRISFITAQELEDRYPGASAKEREHRIALEKKAVFIMQIGGRLNSGAPHDGRAPDYDDWSLNGDIVFWNPVLNCAFELSSMGIRVDAAALKFQLGASGTWGRLSLPFHSALFSGHLPQTMGGGIGQSRLCMFFLEKVHIGEVQASLWDAHTHRYCNEMGIKLL